MPCPTWHLAHIWIAPISSSPQYEFGIPTGSSTRIWNALEPSVWFWHALPGPKLISGMLQGLLATERSITTSTQHNMITANKHIQVTMQTNSHAVLQIYKNSMHIYSVLNISKISSYPTNGLTFVPLTRNYSEENSPCTTDSYRRSLAARW